MSRAITRLKSVFVTFDKVTPQEANFRARKPWNDFYSPMNDYAIGDDKNNPRFQESGEFSFQLQIGAKKMPQSEIRSHQEAFYQLKKCLGIQSSPVHSLDINKMEYNTHKFILGIDCEKNLGSAWTGISTRAGDLMTIKFEHNSTVPEQWASQVYITLQSDNVLEIRDSGISVYD